MKIIQLTPRAVSRGILENGLNYVFKELHFNCQIDFCRPGKSQAGDNAICQSLRWLLKKEFHNSSVSYMELKKNFTLYDINLINKADLLVIGGGGLFISDSHKNTISDWQWGISTDLLEKIKIPIIVYAVGYNRFRGQREFNPEFNATVTKLIEKSLFFSMRNTGSCEAIKRYIPEVLHPNVKLNYCSTLLFNDKFRLVRSTSGRENVGFVFAGDRLENRHANLQRYVCHINEFIRYLKSINVKTILINHGDDTWIQKYIDFDEFIELKGRNSRDVYRIYYNLDTVIGDRGHSQMIPFACGCKLLTPISHDKLKWFLSDMDLDEFGIEENHDHLSEELIRKYEILQSIDWDQLWKKDMKMIHKTNETNMRHIKSLLDFKQ